MSEADDLRRSVPEAIAGVVRNRAMGGELRPGTALRESDLSREFEASRNTVREALLLLEHMGIVERSPHRGSRIALPDAEQMRGLMALRGVVEPGAVWRLTDAPPDELADLLRVARSMEVAAERSDWEAYGSLDLDFHASLVELAGGGVLGRLFRRSLHPLRLAFLASDIRTEVAGMDRHVREHVELIERMLCGDVDGALALIDRHLADAEAALFQVVDRDVNV